MKVRVTKKTSTQGTGPSKTRLKKDFKLKGLQKFKVLAFQIDKMKSQAENFCRRKNKNYKMTRHNFLDAFNVNRNLLICISS